MMRADLLVKESCNFCQRSSPQTFINYAKKWGNEGTYLQVIQSFRYVASLCCTLITDCNITNANMADNGYVQRPQVS